MANNRRLQRRKEIINNPYTFTAHIAVNTYLDMNNLEMVAAIMEKVRMSARIVLLCFDANSDRRTFLLKATEMNMMNNDYQYIVLAIRNIGFGQPSQGKATLSNGMTPFWEDVDGTGDGSGDVVKAAAKKLLIIDTSSDIKDPDYMAKFQDQVVARISQPPLNCVMPRCVNSTGLTKWLHASNFALNRAQQMPFRDHREYVVGVFKWVNSTGQMGRYARHLFDLFYLYGLALHSAGNEFRNTTTISKAMITSFSGLTGDVVMDVNRSRTPVFFLYGLDDNYDQKVLSVAVFNSSQGMVQKFYEDADTTVFAGHNNKRNRSRKRRNLRSQWEIPHTLLLDPMDAVDISTSRRSFASSVQTTPFVSEGDQFEVRVYRGEKVLVTKHSQMELTSAEYDTCVKTRYVSSSFYLKQVDGSSAIMAVLELFRVTSRN
ncbi:hypothetical protein RB195_002675 [Necator americanus]|uniref:Receptor ligand binding region domain-containing protein n=1 Tax=Necator americanus TaxID=51031 RepID=A0ABR1DKE5_NECAM